MAHIEIHALSVKLAGTFEAHVFFPEQEVEKAEEKFPVLASFFRIARISSSVLRSYSFLYRIPVFRINAFASNAFTT